MEQKKPINIVLFYHESLSDEALLLTEEIKKIPFKQGELDIKLLQHTEKPLKEYFDEISGIIFLYTDDLASNENLYEVIHSIEQKADLERYLLLYSSGNSMPNIFHAIRAQQHHMIFNCGAFAKEKGDTHYKDQFVNMFSKYLPKMVLYGEEKKVVRAPFWERLADAWHNPKFRRVLIVVAILFFLGNIILLLLPVLRGSIERREGAYNPNIPVPQMQTYWLNNSFSPFDIESRWIDSNIYKGTNSLSYGASLKNENYVFTIDTDQITKEAVFTRQSVSTWPLDEVMGLSTKFLVEPFEDADSTAEITFAMTLSEQTDYSFGCTVLPEVSEASLECFIDEPGQQVIITAPQSIEINVPHSITIEFEPNTYVLRFFVDDVYFGQAPIPNVEYWRDQKVNAEIIVELQNMDSGTFACQIQDFQIAKQDQ